MSKALEIEIKHLRCEIDAEKRWNETPPTLRTSRGRFDQMTNERKNNISRSLGWGY